MALTSSIVTSSFHLNITTCRNIAPLLTVITGERRITTPARDDRSADDHPHQPLPEVDIPEVPITEFVLRRVADHPDRPAIIDGPSGRSYTFQQLSDAIHALAGGLSARGFGAGSTLALMAPNVPEYAIVFHAVAVVGGTVTTINPTYGAEEVAFQLRDAGATELVTIGMFAEVALAAAAEVGITEVITLDGAEGTTSILSIFGEPVVQTPVDVREDVVVLPYSSGTTGLPKGVMLTHHNLVANICQCDHAIVYTPDGEVALAFLPFFHIYGMQVLMNGLLANGVTVVTLPRFDLDQALGLVQQHRISRFFAVPPVVLALAKHPAVDNYDLSSLKQVFSGAAPLGGEIALEASARIGCEVVQGYGMTELSPPSATRLRRDVQVRVPPESRCRTPRAASSIPRPVRTSRSEAPASSGCAALK